MPRLRPRRDPDRPRRAVSLPQLLPNLLTLGAICAGLTAIRFAIEVRITEAIALVILAAILDALDGRLARMLRSESAIGAELDSLADFLNFGVATGMLVFLSVGLGSLGWIAVMIYVICCVMRLARFNVDARLPSPGLSVPGFIGVPSPAGALLALLPVFAERAMPEWRLPSAAVAIWLIAVGLMMVSRLRTPSLKAIRVRPDMLPYVVVALVAALAVLFTWPWWTLIALDLLYLGVLAYAFLQRRHGPKQRTPDAT